MATVISVTVRDQQVLVNLDMVASITFKPTSPDSSASARIVTAAIVSNRGEDSSGPHVLNVVGDGDVDDLRAELVQAGWLAAETTSQGLPSFKAPKPYNPGWNR
jgi:hypothetical protein